MEEISIRELRNRGGEVVDRVAAAGEPALITRAGRPVAELRPLAPRGRSAEALVAQWRRLPTVDGQSLRADVESVLNTAL